MNCEKGLVVKNPLQSGKKGNARLLLCHYSRPFIKVIKNLRKTVKKIEKYKFFNIRRIFLQE